MANNRDSSGAPLAKQKCIRQNSMTTITNILNQGVATQSSGGTAASQRSEPDDSQSPSFYQEISDIMRGFGDCEKPLSESVMLVEKILLQQIRGILEKAVDAAVERKGKAEPTLKDFYFLMRNSPSKMYRLQRYIKDIQLKRRLQEMIVNDARNLVGYQDELDTNGVNSDDETDREFTEKYDEEKMRRLFRADRISLTLNGAQYREFNEARRSSFYCRSSGIIRMKLRQWLKAPSDIKLSNQIFTILSYLVHETIATIVDFSILTRLDSSNRQTEPYSRIPSSGNSANMLHLCTEVTQGRGQDGIRPITVQEIHEAMRRYAMCANRTMGLYRNSNNDQTIPYLAL